MKTAYKAIKIPDGDGWYEIEESGGNGSHAVCIIYFPWGAKLNPHVYPPALKADAALLYNEGKGTLVGNPDFPRWRRLDGLLSANKSEYPQLAEYAQQALRKILEMEGKTTENPIVLRLKQTDKHPPRTDSPDQN